MGAENASPSGPLATSITSAQEGSLGVKFTGNVRVDAAEFAYIERDCKAFKEEIRDLQGIALNISRREHWGLGETTQDLESSKVMVGWFRGKAAIVDPSRDSPNNVYDILQQHYDIVDQIQTLHRTIAQKYMETDAEFAAEYNSLMANAPASPIGTVKVQPGVTPPSPAVGASS
ncbi:hypothetical protein NONO_c58230 [Nocardia nova SH22a]|uniref:Uncharacterized protein n=1 Tax=Nocardia nova SH22a TaxID=1415166 RepID=W5TML7_9NOCA|nr:hypothetical protein [Nocardia nova]AHH20600.1 hypothetical protein NONO_c58230 [Nocardia nova SH22a]